PIWILAPALSMVSRAGWNWRCAGMARTGSPRSILARRSGRPRMRNLPSPRPDPKETGVTRAIQAPQASRVCRDQRATKATREQRVFLARKASPELKVIQDLWAQKD